jgi:hypothetical protein
VTSILAVPHAEDGDSPRARCSYLTEDGYMNVKRAIVILLIALAVLVVLGALFGLDLGSGGGGGGTGGY